MTNTASSSSQNEKHANWCAHVKRGAVQFQNQAVSRLYIGVDFGRRFGDFCEALRVLMVDFARQYVRLSSGLITIMVMTLLQVAWLRSG